MNTKSVTWFAVIGSYSNYALDAYPEERASYLRELRSSIVGEYPSQAAALEAAAEYMRRRRANAKNAKERVR